MMGKRITRQYRQRPPTLTDGLKRNLAWRYSATGNLPPKTTPFTMSTPVGAHTDAQGIGHIAAVFPGSSRAAVSTRLPGRLLENVRIIPEESPIFLFELCAEY